MPSGISVGFSLRTLFGETLLFFFLEELEQHCPVKEMLACSAGSPGWEESPAFFQSLLSHSPGSE